MHLTIIRNRIKRLMYSFGLLLLIMLSTACLILYVGLHDKLAKTDVAIIPGSKANPDGTPSPRLAARLDKGIELYQKGFFNYIIVSGGTGQESVNEAVVMKNYLIAHHIPAEQIILDTHGDNTEATAKNSATIMNDLHLKSATVISQYFHILRTCLALQQQGMNTLYHAHANYYEGRDLYSLLREIIAYYDYRLFHKSTPIIKSANSV